MKAYYPARNSKKFNILRTKKIAASHDSKSLKIGVIREDSLIGLEKWLPAFWLLSNCESGVSGDKLSRNLSYRKDAGSGFRRSLRPFRNI